VLSGATPGGTVPTWHGEQFNFAGDRYSSDERTRRASQHVEHAAKCFDVSGRHFLSTEFRGREHERYAVGGDDLDDLALPSTHVPIFRKNNPAARRDLLEPDAIQGSRSEVIGVDFDTDTLTA
jgi:hypothetical protein